MARTRRARKHTSKRHKSTGLRRKLLIGLGFLIPLMYFAFTRLFFDPFEASQPSFERLVPQDVDLFVHRKALASDFDVFPEPSVPARWMRTPEWQALTETAWYSDEGWPKTMDGFLEELLGENVELLNDAGPFDLLDDVLGQEIAIVGRSPATAGHLAMLARLTPTAKLALEALDFDGILGGALEGATRTEVSDPEQPAVTWQRLELPGSDPIFYARRTDMVVAGNYEPLVRDILRTVEAGPELSLGLSRLYHDSLQPASRADSSRFTMEWYGDLGHFVEAYDLAPAVDDRHQDALLNVLPRLIDWDLLQEGIGRLEFDSRHIDFTAHSELDVAAASDDKGGLLGSPSFVVEDRLSDLLSMLPESTGGVMTANIDLSRFLNTVVDGLDSELVNLMNGLIRDVSRYNPGWRVKSLPQFMTELARVLKGELTVAFRPLDHLVPPGSQPLPAMAFIAPVKDAAACEALFQAFINANQVLGVDKERMWSYDHNGIGTRKSMGLVGMAAEELSFMVLEGETMVFTTDDEFTLEIFESYTGAKPSAATKLGVSELIEAFTVPGKPRARGNVALWGDVPTIQEMLAPYAEWTAEVETQLDFASLRVVQRKQLIAREYPQYLDDDELPNKVEAEVNEKLDTILTEIDTRRREIEVPALAEDFRESRLWLDLLGQGALSVLLEERATEVAVHLRTVVP
ncbi:MAG: hypothetical protein ACI9EF_001500 [Pseudohongiellaceae bacterium]|jgi:hypothetical protein